jgi:cellulose biosynthesis protein BcsQ
MYLERVLAFVRQSSYASQMIIQTMTGNENEAAVIEAANTTAFLICSLDYYNPEILKLYKGRMLLLSDQNIKDQRFSCRVFWKYQPIHQLLQDIKVWRNSAADPAEIRQDPSLLLIHESNGTTEEASLSDEMRVISIYSMDGGSGKTTTAYYLAHYFNKLNKKVFYLNLETYSTSPCFTEFVQRISLSELLYYLKTGPEVSTIPLSTQGIEVDRSISCFEPAYHLRDLCEMSSFETDHVFGFLREQGDYDVIIVDLDSSLHSRTISALQQSDAIWWVFNPDWRGRYRFETFLDQLRALCGLEDREWQNKLFFILNKYIGHYSVLESKQEKFIDGHLPYIPEWKEISLGEQHRLNKDFEAAIAQMAERWEMQYGQCQSGGVGAAASR